MPYNVDWNAYIPAVFRAFAGNNSISPSAIQRTTVNGIPASYSTARVNSQSGQVDVTVFAYEFSRGQAFHFVALTQAGRGSAFNSMRSEEHTSELQSLMRISYAVFCLKKTKRTNIKPEHQTRHQRILLYPTP